MQTRRIAIGYARGLLGGMLIGTPAMLTMEMWWEGFFVPAWRLLLLYAVTFVVLFILQHYSGLTEHKTIRGQVRAAVVAYGIGIVASLIVLFALGVVHTALPARDLAGKLLLESVPVSIGASVAMSEFGDGHHVAEIRRKHAGYWGTLGISLSGAVLFGFALSGTEEPLLIAEQLSWDRAALLVMLSILQVFGIVYAMDHKQRPHDVGTPEHRLVVVREALSTYALAVVVGAYFLWTFGTIGPHVGLIPSLYAVVTIGLVTSLGAAAAELLI